jgi:hypothetical protein
MRRVEILSLISLSLGEKLYHEVPRACCLLTHAVGFQDVTKLRWHLMTVSPWSQPGENLLSSLPNSVPHFPRL